MSKIRIALGAAALAALIACGSPSRTDRAIDQAASAPVVEPTTGTPTGAVPTPRVTKTIGAEQLNAAASARSYLDGGHGFSRKGLIEQLEYEGYPAKASTAAVDSLGVDWNAQAARSAKSYLSGQAFSRKGLTEQLEYEGFTHAQAAHGVKAAGL